MALKSKLFAGDARVEAIAASDAQNVKTGDRGEHVRKIQLALNALAAAGLDPDGMFGSATQAAVLSFKTARAIINRSYQSAPDAIVGKMTIARLDAEMLEFERRIVPPPTPPTPPPQPLDVEEAKRAISAYLRREAKHNVAEILLGQPANLLVFGEIHHIGDPMKAFLFAELIGRVRIRRPVNTHFHASERFMNKEEIRRQISDVLQASPFGMDRPIAKLDGDLQPFIPVLAAANSYPGRRFGVIPSNAASAPEDQRHQTIFNAFNDAAARCPDVPQRSIQSAVSRGHFLLGARHAARKSIIGSAAATTAQRLESAGWRIHAIRLTDPLEWQKSPDSMRMRPVGGNDKRIIDGLSLIDGASNRNYYADITKPDSPFARLKLVDSGAHDIPVNALFDAIVHLGGPASL